MSTVRWNIAVSPGTDQSVRMYLAGQGGGRKMLDQRGEKSASPGGNRQMQCM